MPGIVVSVLAGLAFGGRLAAVLGARRWVGSLLLIAIGSVVSATLTPGRDALAHGATGQLGCDLTRIGLAPPSELLGVSDASMNFTLYVPLGVAVGLLPGRSRALFALLALAMPFAIEAFQSVAPSLDRACQSADVVDNITGLLGGLIAVALAAWLRHG